MIVSGAPMLRYSSASVNIVFDGNSFVAGYAASGATAYLPAQMAVLAPLNGSVAVANIGVSGQKISDMRSRGAAYADAAYVAGKKNVLFALEGFNTIANGGVTGMQAGQQMAAYCAERLAAHPDWKIVLVGTIATTSAGSTSIAALNTELLAYDAYLRANVLAMGAKRFVDARADGTFAYTGTSFSGVQAPLMSDAIHPNDAGYGRLAQYCAATLRRIPAR